MISKKIFPDKRTDSLSVGNFGFGCVGLTALDHKADALELLEKTYEMGIRHFDVARLYGMGVCEEILGEFARSHRSEIIICTKYGLSPPAVAGHVPTLQSIKRILKKVPFVDRVVRKRIADLAPKPNYGRDAAERALEISLAALKTDYLDIWLLHEARIEDLLDDDLISYLSSIQEKGIVRCFGIGSAFHKIASSKGPIPDIFQVMQFENSLIEQNFTSNISHLEQRYCITHSALKSLPNIRALLGANKDIVRRFQDEHGFDLSNIRVICSILLAWAAYQNPHGLVLFGSTSITHIESNLRLICDPLLTCKVVNDFEALIFSLRNAKSAVG